MKSTHLVHVLLGSAAFVAVPVTAQAATPVAPVSPAETALPSKPDTNAAGEVAQDIVVTAQKRSESAQRVPITIAAFTAPMLAQANVVAVTDLPRIVPTLKLGTTPGGVGTRFVIRGIGSFGNSALEPSVAAFVDGIYVPRPSSLVGTFLDIAGVEVLSGPQGTIFGRNASAGAISLRTGSPTGDLSGTFKAEAETGELYRLSGVLNVPISDRVAIRAAAMGSSFGGYWHNTTTGKRFGGVDTLAGRLSLKAELTNSLVWNVKADYQKLNGNFYLNYQLDPATLTPTTLANLTRANNGIAPDLVLFDRNNNVASDPAHIDDSIWGVTSDLGWTFGGGYSLRLLQGYRQWKANEEEADAAGLAVFTTNRTVEYLSKSHSHELQIVSPSDALLGGRLSFVAGLYYFHEDLNINYFHNISRAGGFCEKFIGTTPAKAVQYNACLTGTERDLYDIRFAQSTESIAGYGQATLTIVPTVKLTFGARWTQDKKLGSYVAVQANAAASVFGVNENTPNLSYEQSKVTYRGSLTWEPVSDVMLFANYSTGFKSGGFNSGSATTVLGQARLFAPETVKNYEIGWKARFFDRMLTFNTTLFRMDIDGYQERAANGTGGSILRNVGSLRNQGADIDLVLRPDSHITANVSAAYLDSKFLSYVGAPNPPYIGGFQDLTGQPVTYAPKWSVSTGGQVGYDIANTGMRWVMRGDVSYTSSQYMGSQIDESPLALQEAYTLLGARFTLYGKSDKWSLAVFGRNLTDKGYCTGRVYNPLDSALGLRYVGGTAIRCSVGSPRTIGISGSVNF
jgi:iron complex outermembrane receptor protein